MVNYNITAFYSSSWRARTLAVSITSLRPVESYSLVMRWNSTEYASSPWWEDCTLDQECEYLSGGGGGGVVDVAELGLVYWATGERCERGINQ